MALIPVCSAARLAISLGIVTRVTAGVVEEATVVEGMAEEDMVEEQVVGEAEVFSLSTIHWLLRTLRSASVLL